MEDYLKSNEFQTLLNLALTEDIGGGDYTSLACIEPGKKESAVMIAKEQGIIAGVELGEYIFNKVNSKLKVHCLKKDGDLVQVGDEIMKISGDAVAILTAERTVLNFMQRLSGVATTTNKVTQLLKGTNTKVLDTRKTTPAYRFLEKWAVKTGGGTNHRFGLYDMILIKDNHVDYAGGIIQAIQNSVAYLKIQNLAIPIEIEVRSMMELESVMQVGKVDRILLDNFTPKEVKEAVQLIGKRFITEASGGITLDNCKAYADAGVDFISMGAITHSVKSLDLSLII
ncbi:MAG: nicotinate-nucleotide pyrophosphorylase (carboxylating) [Sphingobacteriales bacterium]|jgi:nicotinate-nucleotide pyrophosphorylase (carboxylating)